MTTLDKHTVPPRLHSFGAGPEYLVGVEEELMLVDPFDGMLAPEAPRLLSALADDRHVKHELMRCQVEIATDPQPGAENIAEELAALRGVVANAAAERGLCLVGAGAHPIALAEEQPITQRDRYRELVADLRYPVRRELCFGLHVHVSVGGADKAIAVMEAILPELPVLLALSASSPFWRGDESGLQSTRTVVFQSLPRTGLPPAFPDYEAFALALDQLAAANAVRDHSFVWWDVRPHPGFGTIEVRLMDAQPRLLDSAALAGLVQALVRHHGRAFDHGQRWAPADRFVVSENRWQAARYGLRARLAAHERGSEPVPLRAAVRRLLERVADDAAALGGSWLLDRVSALVADGTSADRQLRRFRERHELADVVQLLGAESREELHPAF
jgi:carboxylate-amine ligase